MIKMVILDQSKPISLIFEKKIQKFEKTKFVHCTFIIHKTEITQVISTSFIFNNIFCEMKDKKVIHWGGMGNCPNFVLEV